MEIGAVSSKMGKIKCFMIAQFKVLLRWLELKEYDCVQIGHHKRVVELIEDYQKDGWHLHTYQAQSSPTIVNHYLLVEWDR